jgi:hypothetical protein
MLYQDEYFESLDFKALLPDLDNLIYFINL